MNILLYSSLSSFFWFVTDKWIHLNLILNRGLCQAQFCLNSHDCNQVLGLCSGGICQCVPLYSGNFCRESWKSISPLFGSAFLLYRMVSILFQLTVAGYALYLLVIIFRFWKRKWTIPTWIALLVFIGDSGLFSKVRVF